MGPDRAGRYRAEPVDPVVSPGVMARGMGSALAADRVCVLRDECPALGWPALHHPERDVSILTPEDRRMIHNSPEIFIASRIPS